jgi:hypothetical protein
VIVADDASGVGVLDDPLLLGCAVAAVVTLIATERRASRGEHDKAWGRLQSSLDALRDAVAPTSSAGTGECAEPRAPADVDAEGEAGERETVDVAPVPAERRRRHTCATSMPDELACGKLPFEYTYSSRRAALIEMKTRTGDNGLRLHRRERVFGGPCPGKGMHYNVRVGSRRVGSIACCTCCLDTSRGPNRTEQCRIIW